MFANNRQGGVPTRSNRYRLVRVGSRGGAVDDSVGGEHSTDQSPAWSTNRDANKGANSARVEGTALRAGGGANARPDRSAGYKADEGMLAALGAGGCSGVNLRLSWPLVEW
jgi:hypothetical protein